VAPLAAETPGGTLGHPVLAGVPREEAVAIARLARVVRASRGAVFEAAEVDDGLRLVLGGRLRVVGELPGGRRLTLGIVGPGDVFGWFADRMDSDTRPAGAEALDLVVVAELARPALERALLGSPRFAVNLLATASRLLREAEDRLELLARQPLQERVAATVLALARRHGRSCSEGVRIDVPHTHAQLADLAGASRETVTKAVGVLREAGVVDLRGRELWVLDPDALERRAAVATAVA
jgi:CRP/FNR family transcriptional regulator